jgi:hypothetical protein
VVSPGYIAEGSDLTPRADAADDTQTERLPRVEPPLPGSLDPTRPAAERPSPPAPSPPANAESTAVLSIDDLMAPPSPTAPRAAPKPGAAPKPTRDRLRTDAAAAWAGAVRRTRTWLDQGDNAVVAATVAVALLLFIVVTVYG